MNQTIKYGLIFVSGATIGVVSTYFIMRKKHLSFVSSIENKIDEVVNRQDQVDETEDETRQNLAEAAKNKPDIFTYTENMNYANAYKPQIEYPDTEVELEEPVEEDGAEEQKYLYEITTSEFASYTNDRIKITLFWFLDDVFTDEMYGKIDPRDYLNGYLKLLDDNTPIDPIDYIRKMAKDEICIRDFDSNLDIDICTQAMTYSDYMST